MSSKKLFHNERDRASLQAANPRQIRTGDWLANPNLVEDQVPVYLPRCPVGGTLLVPQVGLSWGLHRSVVSLCTDRTTNSCAALGPCTSMDNFVFRRDTGM